MAEIREPQRLSIRVSAELNDWLDRESKESGISKTAIIAFATEQYRQQKNTTVSMPEMLELMKTQGSM